MRKMLLSIGAAALAASLPIAGAGTALAKTTKTHHAGSSHTTKCRYSKGTTGLIAGGDAGGVVGHEVIGHGVLGVGAGAVGGALAGRAIDRTLTKKKRCR